MARVNIYCAYSSRDEPLFGRLAIHLYILTSLGLANIWHRRKIDAGSEWVLEINARLEAADIILLLISPDFLASGYCDSSEMTKALQRHEQGTARVIPILLRPVAWQGMTFEKLQMLPTNGRPVTSWRQRDEAFVDIVRGIRKVAEDLQIIVQKRQTESEKKGLLPGGELSRRVIMPLPVSLLQCIQKHETSGLYEEYYAKSSKVVLERALSLKDGLTANEAYLVAHISRMLHCCEEALQCYDMLIKHDPNAFVSYYGKGSVLYKLERHDEACIIYEQALRLDSGNAYGWYSYSIALQAAQYYDKSIITRQRAVSLEPNIDDLYPDWLYALQ